MELTSNTVDEFREFLSHHARHPSNVGDTAVFLHRGACANPLCGDAVNVGLKLHEGMIEKIAIQTSGCGIATASSSLMSELAQGKTKIEALSMLEQFNQALLASPKEKWPESLSSLRAFSRLRESPTRVPCALIGWFALKDALKN